MVLRTEPLQLFELQRSTGQRFGVRRPKCLLIGRTRYKLPVSDDGILERTGSVAPVRFVRIELLNLRKGRARRRKSE